MVRVKRGVAAHKRREKLLSYVKGFKWGRKSKERLAREALLHAWSHAFVGRKMKKRASRRLWQTKIGAAAKAQGLSYSKLLGAMRKKNIALDRKVLAQIAQQHPAVFDALMRQAA